MTAIATTTYTRTERAVAADLIVDLMHAKYLPQRADALARVRDLWGLTSDEIRAAVDRHVLRHRLPRDLSALPYTYGDTDFSDIPESFAAPTPPPATPDPAPPPDRAGRSPRPTSKGPSPLAIRFGVARNGFMLPDGTYVGYLSATAEQHAARAGWLHSAAAVVSAAADYHQACADAITAAGVTCLAQLAESDRPPVPELTP